MHLTVSLVLLLLAVVTLVGTVARRWSLREPILLLVVGLALGLWPAFPRVELEPSLFFALFLPPLLYADGWLTNLREFRRLLRPILLLSIGLVIFTTLAVGYFVHWMLPAIPLAVAFALGAIVSPTDAIATEAILERVGAPLRIRAILSGESLVNDASGLVALRFAVVAVASGVFEVRAAVVEFGRLALGGIAVGLLVGIASAAIRRWLERQGRSDGMLEVAVSLLTPFAAAFPAEALHVSGVLAVVVAGLYNGWSDPVQLSAETRATAWSVWSMFLFLLNGTVFLLLGLQMPILFEELRDVWWVALAYYAAIVTLLVMALRLLWVFPGAYLPRWLSRRVREREPEPSFKGVFVVGWSGLRGAVTLAAALAIPTHLPGGEPFPSRSFVIFLAGSVIVGTLLVQGLSLPWLVRRLGVRADRELAEEERGARRAVNEAQLARLRTLVERKSAACDPSIAAKIEVELAEGIELLAAPESDSTPAAERRRRERELRAELVAVGRDAALALYREGAVNDEIFRSLQGDLDLAEARLRAL